MSNLGKYQSIVEEAYKAGGVDVWIEKIKDAAYAQGSADTKNKLLLPLSVVCVAIGATGQYAYHKIAPKIKANIAYKKQLKKDAEQAEILLKSELETQINDVEQPNNNVDILA